MDTLTEANGFPEPRVWVSGPYAPMGEAVGGAWAAGRLVRAVSAMIDRHPGGRVVACSHGDVIPVFLALVCGLFSTPVPEPAEHGGWYHLRFSAGTMQVATRP